MDNDKTVCCDLLLVRARIIDGSGTEPFEGCVAVKDGRITGLYRADAYELTETGDLLRLTAQTSGKEILIRAEETVDAGGLCLTPGFIDIHAHSDLTLPHYPLSESRILQGVTTELTGNCGMSAFPVADGHREELAYYLRECWDGRDFEWESIGGYLSYLEKLGTSTNIGILTGHGSIRLAVMGFSDAVPTDEEMAQMKALLRRDLE